MLKKRGRRRTDKREAIAISAEGEDETTRRRRRLEYEVAEGERNKRHTFLFFTPAAERLKAED